MILAEISEITSKIIWLLNLMFVGNTSIFLLQSLDTAKKDTASVTKLSDNGIENALLN